jgi:tetratricopeptide (TPR) repeat protein
MCAAKCAEGEGDWQRAETWYSRTSQRYPQDSLSYWYLFCKRTGKGNIESARKLIEQYMADRPGRPDLVDPHYAGCFYWVDGRLDEAKKTLTEAYTTKPDIRFVLGLAVLADGAKDAPRRDALLTEVVTKYAGRSPKTAAITKLLLESIFNPGGAKPLDVAALDRIVESLPENARGNSCISAALLLKNHADPKTAKKYLELCARSPNTYLWYQCLAQLALKQLDGQ